MTRAARPDGQRPQPLATVGALIIAPGGEALFVRTAKWRGRWGVPGGKIEAGESIAQALAREVAEETGLTLHDVRWAPTLEAVRLPDFARDAHMVLLNFVARCASRQVRLNDEADALCWLRPREALGALDLNRPTRALVRHYLRSGHSGAPLPLPGAA